MGCVRRLYQNNPEGFLKVQPWSPASSVTSEPLEASQKCVSDPLATPSRRRCPLVTDSRRQHDTDRPRGKAHAGTMSHACTNAVTRAADKCHAGARGKGHRPTADPLLLLHRMSTPVRRAVAEAIGATEVRFTPAKREQPTN